MRLNTEVKIYTKILQSSKPLKKLTKNQPCHHCPSNPCRRVVQRRGVGCVGADAGHPRHRGGAGKGAGVMKKLGGNALGNRWWLDGD